MLLFNKNMSNLQKSNLQGHSFHLVSPSPWPLFTCISLLTLTTLGVLTMHSFVNTKYWLVCALFCLVSSMSLWFIDVIAEGTSLNLSAMLKFVNQSPPKPFASAIPQHSASCVYTVCVGSIVIIITNDLPSNLNFNDIFIPLNYIYENLRISSLNHIINVPSFSFKDIQLVWPKEKTGHLLPLYKGFDILNNLDHACYYNYNFLVKNFHIPVYFLMPFIGMISYKFISFTLIDDIVKVLTNSFTEFKRSFHSYNNIENKIPDIKGRLISKFNYYLSYTHYYVFMNTVLPSGQGQGEGNGQDKNPDKTGKITKRESSAVTYRKALTNLTNWVNTLESTLDSFISYLASNNITYIVDGNGASSMEVPSNYSTAQIEEIRSRLQRYDTRVSWLVSQIVDGVLLGMPLQRENALPGRPRLGITVQHDRAIRLLAQFNALVKEDRWVLS